MRLRILKSHIFFCINYKKNNQLKFSWLLTYDCRPTGIRTPTGGTKNRSATVTPWVCRLLWCKCTAFFLTSKLSSKKITYFYKIIFQTTQC